MTTQPGTRSKGSLRVLIGDALSWPPFSRAYKRHQTAERWRQAVQRRDELQRLRAEAVRLHRPVKQIDAELQPLVHRMMAGAI